MKRKLKKALEVSVFALLLCLVVAMTVWAERIADDSKRVNSHNHALNLASPSEVPDDDLEDEVVPDDRVPDESTTNLQLKQVDFITQEPERPKTASPSNAEYIPAENVTWEDGYPGWGTWSQDQFTEEEKGEIHRTRIKVYCDDEFVGNWNMGEYRKESDMRYYFNQPGDYYFQATFQLTSDWDDIGDVSWSEPSDTYQYVRPEKSMPKVKGIEWLADGTIRWEEVPIEEKYPAANSYVVEIYQKQAGTGEYERIDSYYSRSGELTNFSGSIEKGAVYKCKVVALGDLEEYANSTSDFSREFTMGSQSAGSIIGGLGEGDVKSNVENAALSSTEKDTLKLTVQNDPGVAQSYKELEESYKDKAGKSDMEIKTEGSGIDTGKIDVVGGVLNGATAIEFSKPDQGELDDANIAAYKKRTAVSISLEGVDSSELKFPVLITMAVPQGINPRDLVIFHKKHDNTTETIYPRDNGDGTVSFAVNEFSIFYFVDNTSKDNNNVIGGNSSGGGGGGGGGSSSKGSPAAAVDPLETAGTWVQDEIGWWFKKLDGTYPVSQWLMNGGNWYRFDEKGYMVTGWFTDEAGKKFYLNPVSDGTRGVMKTGWQEIDGKWYYFNTTSDGTKGAMLVNVKTPDGYQVGADGAWVKN